jgi:hypothetical protein
MKIPTAARSKCELLISRNRILAKKLWGDFLDPAQLRSLRELTQHFSFSLALGDMRLLQGAWYVTHTGLLRLSRRSLCAGIDVEAVTQFCNAQTARWTFRATVFKSRTCKGFVGYGDADPSNVSPLVRGAEMRVAETRAVNRALRKAYGIGICSVEEIGSVQEPTQAQPHTVKLPSQPANENYGGPKVRDQLCQIIRQHQLDATLVKSYAVDFCGTKSLREASREQVENFVAHLADWVERDRNALLCQLNSFVRPQEGAA